MDNQGEVPLAGSGVALDLDLELRMVINLVVLWLHFFLLKHLPVCGMYRSSLAAKN